MTTDERVCGRCGVTPEGTRSINHVVADECVDGHTWDYVPMMCQNCGDAVTHDASDNTWVGSNGEVTCPLPPHPAHGPIVPDTVDVAAFDRVNEAIKELWARAEEAGLSVLSNDDEADDGTPQVVLTLEGRWPDGA